MSEVTVSQLAEVLGVDVPRLIEQLNEAGIKVSDPSAAVTNDDKKKLLAYLRTSHGKLESGDAHAGPSKVTLKRKTVSELKVPTGGAGRTRTRGAAPSRTVNVEVRKKRTYVKRGAVEEEQLADPEREAAAKALAEARAQREQAEKEAVEDAKRREEARQQREAEEAVQREAREAEQAEERAAREAREAADQEEKARKQALAVAQAMVEAKVARQAQELEA